MWVSKRYGQIHSIKLYELWLKIQHPKIKYGNFSSLRWPRFVESIKT